MSESRSPQYTVTRALAMFVYVGMGIAMAVAMIALPASNPPTTPGPASNANLNYEAEMDAYIRCGMAMPNRNGASESVMEATCGPYPQEFLPPQP